MTFRRLLARVGLCLLGVASPGCAGLQVTPGDGVAVEERPFVAVLPFGIDVEITSLSTLKSVEETLLAEEEARQVTAALQEIRADARWLLLSGLAAGQRYQFVSVEETDAAAAALHLHPGALPTAEQLAELRGRLGADLVVAGSILDYGRIRWQWLAAGAFADLSAETLALGLATAWNPVGLAANAGYEVLTNSAIFFGGGYLFGVALRPVRVEARAFETDRGYPVWQDMEGALYAWHDLEQIPESERSRKELQLRVNLAKAVRGLADSLTETDFTVSRLRRSTPGATEFALSSR